MSARPGVPVSGASREGQTFAGSYRVVSLSNESGCGRFVYGDDTFRLCEGDEILK